MVSTQPISNTMLHNMEREALIWLQKNKKSIYHWSRNISKALKVDGYTSWLIDTKESSPSYYNEVMMHAVFKAHPMISDIIIIPVKYNNNIYYIWWTDVPGY